MNYSDPTRRLVKSPLKLPTYFHFLLPKYYLARLVAKNQELIQLFYFNLFCLLLILLNRQLSSIADLSLVFVLILEQNDKH
jgi:hypothetical protein